MELKEIERVWEKQEEVKRKKEEEEIAKAKFEIEKPPIFQDAHFSNLDLPFKSIEVLKDWLQYPEEPLLLVGKPGTGKTFAAYACLDYLCRASFERFKLRVKEAYQLNHFSKYGLYEIWNLSKLYQKWLKTFKQNQYDDSFITTLCETRYLILDDLGTREPSPAFLDVIYCIVNERIENKMATIFTTNISVDEMEELFGSRLVSRILSGAQILFEGPDRRMKKNKGKP